MLCKIIPVDEAGCISLATEVLVREEMNFDVIFLSLYENKESNANMSRRITIVKDKHTLDSFTSTSFNVFFCTIVYSRFGTFSQSLTCRPLTSEYVTNRRRSSWTGGVNSTPRLGRKTSTGRTWREASTR